MSKIKSHYIKYHFNQFKIAVRISVCAVLMVLLLISQFTLAHEIPEPNSKKVFITLDDIINRAKIPIEHRIRHHLTKEQIQYLREIGENEGAWRGWKELSLYGDSYAKIAAKIVLEPEKDIDKFYHRMVKINWQNCVGPTGLVKYFDSVANQHYRQYVEALKTGYWPDTFQICMSARKAADDHNIPTKVVFYGIWEKSPIGKIIQWQRLAGLESQRIADCREVFRDLPESLATSSLVKNIISFYSGE